MAGLLTGTTGETIERSPRVTEPSVRTVRAAARIAHDLGLAACFGGTLFGKVVFNSSLPAVGSKTERGRLGAAFWNSANPVNAAAFGLAVATWLPGPLGRSCGEAEGGRGVCSLLRTPSWAPRGRPAWRRFSRRSRLTDAPRRAPCRSNRGAYPRPKPGSRRP